MRDMGDVLPNGRKIFWVQNVGHAMGQDAVGEDGLRGDVMSPGFVLDEGDCRAAVHGNTSRNSPDRVSGSISASTPACHAGERGSTPRQRGSFSFTILLRSGLSKQWTLELRLGRDIWGDSLVNSIV